MEKSHFQWTNFRGAGQFAVQLSRTVSEEPLSFFEQVFLPWLAVRIRIVPSQLRRPLLSRGRTCVRTWRRTILGFHYSIGYQYVSVRIGDAGRCRGCRMKALCWLPLLEVGISKSSGCSPSP